MSFSLFSPPPSPLPSLLSAPPCPPSRSPSNLLLPPSLAHTNNKLARRLSNFNDVSNPNHVVSNSSQKKKKGRRGRRGGGEEGGGGRREEERERGRRGRRGRAEGERKGEEKRYTLGGIGRLFTTVRCVLPKSYIYNAPIYSLVSPPLSPFAHSPLLPTPLSHTCVSVLNHCVLPTDRRMIKRDVADW
jgi:hypothetical protein